MILRFLHMFTPIKCLNSSFGRTRNMKGNEHKLWDFFNSLALLLFPPYDHCFLSVLGFVGKIFILMRIFLSGQPVNVMFLFLICMNSGVWKYY